MTPRVADLGHSADHVVAITIPPSAPAELVRKVDAMAEDLARSGLTVEIEIVRTCRSCECTDDRACFGGCSWISDDDDLCSSCATPAAERSLT